MASYRLEHGPVKDACLHSNFQSQHRTQKGWGVWGLADCSSHPKSEQIL